MDSPVFPRFLFGLLLLTAFSCSSDMRTSYSVQVARPPSAGAFSIDMRGSWKVVGVRDARGPGAQALRETWTARGVLLELGASGFVSLGGVPLDRSGLERRLGTLLDDYRNGQDGRFCWLRYAWSGAGGASGLGRKGTVAVAGGALSSDVLLVQVGLVTWNPGGLPFWGRLDLELERALP